MLKIKGSILVEFALVFPIVLSFIFAVIDVGRYWSAQNLLQSGATSAVNLAVQLSVSDLDIWFGDEDSGTPGFQNSKLTAFLDARSKVANEATSLALASFIGDSSSSNSVKLMAFQYPLSVDGQVVDSSTYDAVLLRPGEDVQRVEDGVIFSHPTYSDPPTKEGEYNEILFNHPFVVLIQAKYKWIFPYLSDTIITAQSAAFKEYLNQGVIPDVYDPPTPPPPTPTPTATVSSTPTSGGGGGTPTPGDTSTPTPTPIPTVSCDVCVGSSLSVSTCLSCVVSGCSVCGTNCQSACESYYSYKTNPCQYCENILNCGVVCPPPSATNTPTPTPTPFSGGE